MVGFFTASNIYLPLGFIGNQGSAIIYALLLFLLPLIGAYFTSKDYERYRNETQNAYSYHGFFREFRYNDIVLIWFWFLGLPLFIVPLILLFAYADDAGILHVLLALVCSACGILLLRFGEYGLRNKLKISKQRRREILRLQKASEKKSSRSREEWHRPGRSNQRLEGSAQSDPCFW